MRSRHMERFWSTGGQIAQIEGTNSNLYDTTTTVNYITGTYQGVDVANWDVVQLGPIYCSETPQMATCPDVTPTGPTPVINSFTASTTSTKPGQPVVLSWSITGASSRLSFITPTGGAVAGNTLTVNPTATTTYTIHSENAYGRTTASVTITVTPPAATMTSSGNWNDPTKWSGGVVPGRNYTASIADGVTATCTDAETIGNSPAAGNVVLNLNNSGQLALASGCTFTARGDITYTAGIGNQDPVITLGAGSHFIWDASGAAFAPAVNYSLYPSGDGGGRIITSTGTSGSHATISSNTDGGAGYFTLNGHDYGGPFSLTYTDVSFIGDSTHNAFEFWEFPFATVDTQHTMKAVNSTFDHVGKIKNDATYNGIAIIDWENNAHTNTTSPDGIFGWAVADPIMAGGVRNVLNNIFDIPTSEGNFGGVQDFAQTGNYFGGMPLFSTTTAFASLTGNFLRGINSSFYGGMQLNFTGTSSGDYVFVDDAYGNPHLTGNNNTTPSTMTQLIFGKSGGTHNGGNDDSGEIFGNSTPASGPVAYSVDHTIVLPSSEGFSWAELFSQSGLPDNRYSFLHNTWFGGWNNFPPYSRGGGAALQFEEQQQSTTAAVPLFESNLMWNPGLGGYPAQFAKANNLCAGSPPVTTDPITTADYNGSFNAKLTPDTASSCSALLTGQADGYQSKFTYVPGVHDVDNQDPQFIDYQRTVELYDSKGLGHTAPAWDSTVAYHVGDIVSHARSDKYWNLSINYRYTNGTYDGFNCGNVNYEPGDDTSTYNAFQGPPTPPSWRTCWEWASLYDIRQGIAGVAGYSPTIIADIIAWIQAGYLPTNTAYIGAGADGVTIGAVH